MGQWQEYQEKRERRKEKLFRYFKERNLRDVTIHPEPLVLHDFALGFRIMNRGSGFLRRHGGGGCWCGMKSRCGSGI